MVDAQIWLVHALTSVSTVAGVMRTTWAWPIAESLHFIGLTLLIGTVGVFDLRLLGIATRIPISALHSLVPWGVAGFVLTVLSGLSFLMTEPDQYVFNSSFHLKMLFMAVAGLNALTFYLTCYRRTVGPSAPANAPRAAKVIAAISLAAWLSVTVAGRLLTFYRPFPCESGEVGFIAACLPGAFEGYTSPRELSGP
jgi:hypothetical protein